MFQDDFPHSFQSVTSSGVSQALAEDYTACFFGLTVRGEECSGSANLATINSAIVCVPAVDLTGLASKSTLAHLDANTIRNLPDGAGILSQPFLVV